MLTYYDIAINYDLFASYLYEAYIIFLYLCVVYKFYGFSFTLESPGLYIHLEKVFALIPIISVYNSYSKIYSWQNFGLFFVIIDLISKIISFI